MRLSCDGWPSGLLTAVASSQRVTRAGDERRVRGAAVAPRDELHVHRAGLDVTRPLVVDQQLLDERRQELDARLPLARTDRAPRR